MNLSIWRAISRATLGWLSTGQWLLRIDLNYVASMNTQEEFDISNPPSDRPSVVEGKNNSAMRCANPQCSKELLYLREGSLQLLSLDSDSDDRPLQDDGAFAMKPLRSKFFWLCGECSKTHIVKQWTMSGLVLVLRNQKTAGNRPNLINPAVAASAQPRPVLPIVPPLPPIADPIHRSALPVIQKSFLGTKTG